MEETVVLENTGNEAIDLDGYQLDWEHADDQTQTDSFEEGVTIEAGAARVVRFLASDDASFMRGTAVDVDGGWLVD